jgi:hypothetical protein
VVRDVLEWRSSRGYLYWRVKRRVAEQALRKQLTPHLSHDDATAKIKGLMGHSYDGDKAFLDKLASDGAAVHAGLATFKTTALAASVAALLTGLSPVERAAVVAGI